MPLRGRRHRSFVNGRENPIQGVEGLLDLPLAVHRRHVEATVLEGVAIILKLQLLRKVDRKSGADSARLDRHPVPAAQLDNAAPQGLSVAVRVAERRASLTGKLVQR